MTRKRFLMIAGIANILFLLSILLYSVSLPNTKIGDYSAGFKTRRQVRDLSERIYKTPIAVDIASQQYDLTYEHLGAYLNEEALISRVFSAQQKSFPALAAEFVRGFFRPTATDIPLSFTQEFDEYVGKINAAQSRGESIVYLDQNDKQATLFTPKEKREVNVPAFRATLAQHFGRKQATLLVPMREIPSDVETKVLSANASLLGAYGTPLTLIIGLDGANKFLTLSPEDLKRYTKATFAPGLSGVEFSLEPQFFSDFSVALESYRLPYNRDVALSQANTTVRDALVSRYRGESVDSVKINVDSGPNTDGKVAARYIEVDISQQKMFTFKDGNLLKTYRVSTGKDYPTPVGSFTILNKLSVGFSNIYNVWMPYWMAFSYSDTLHAYFGIHELPFYYSGDQKIQRPREFIGAPNTGGCVALDIGDAKEVFQFADIGTPVVIYQ